VKYFLDYFVFNIFSDATFDGIRFSPDIKRKNEMAAARIGAKIVIGSENYVKGSRE